MGRPLTSEERRDALHRTCLRCAARPGEPCRTRSGLRADAIHRSRITGRLRHGGGQGRPPSVWRVRLLAIPCRSCGAGEEEPCKTNGTRGVQQWHSARWHDARAEHGLDRLELLGAEVRRRRRDLGLTLRGLAQRAGCRVTYLHRLELGRVQESRKLESIATALGCAVGDLWVDDLAAAE